MLFQGFHPTNTTNTTSSVNKVTFELWSLSLRYLRAACTKDKADEDDEEDEDGDDCHEDPNQRSNLEEKDLLDLVEELFRWWQSLCEYQEGWNVYFGLGLIRFANLNAANFFQNFAPHSEDGMANSQLSKKQRKM